MGVCVGPLQWQELLLGNRHTMRAMGMLLLGMLARMGTPQQLGYGGLPGQRTAGQEVCGPPTLGLTKDTGQDRQDSTTPGHTPPSPPPSPPPTPSSGPPQPPSGQAQHKHCLLCSGLTRFYSAG